jgi:4-amino-4-deoxy-L-arabinose transferase-like glycosyltransferase
MMSAMQTAPCSHQPISWLWERRSALLPLSLLMLCGLLYFWRLGVTPLDDFDEAYYAEGAREMLERADLGTPYFNGRPFLLKPVLIYWLIAAAFRLLGPTEFAARAVSAFFGTGIVLLTYWFAARTVGRRAGLLAGAALALCYMWIDTAREAMIDMPLTAALAGAMFLFFLANTASTSDGRRLYLWMYPLLGVALLAKGPAPVGVALVAVFLYLTAAGRLKETLREAQLVPGIALMLAVAGPWYVYEALRQPEFLSTFFVGEHFGHVHGTLARTEPWWGHLKNLLVYFYPWAAFLPAALMYAFRQRPRDDVLRFAAWWAIAVIVTFSLARAKLAHYLVPAFPAMAILVGGWLDGWLEREPMGRAGSGLAFGLLAVGGAACAVGAALLATMPPMVSEPLAEKYGAWAPGGTPVVILGALAAGSLGAALGAAAGRRGAAPALLAGAMLVAGLAHVGWFKPRIAEIQAQPRKELAQIAAETLDPEEPLGVFYAKRNATIYYARRPIVDLGEEEAERLVDFLSSPTPAAALTHEQFLPLLEESVSRLSVWARRGEYVLVSNHVLGQMATLAE